MKFKRTRHADTFRVRWDIANCAEFENEPHALRVFLAACSHYVEHGPKCSERLARSRFAYCDRELEAFNRLLERGAFSFADGFMTINEMFGSPAGRPLVVLSGKKKAERARRKVELRLRFKVFLRDSFRCVYCGATPGTSRLHIDHVRPVSGGGGNDEGNLVTACAECNLGKSDSELSESMQ